MTALKMKLFSVRISHKKAVITVVDLLRFRWSRFLIILTPSSFGMLVYNDRTSRVNKKQSFDSEAGTLSNSFKKCLVSLMWDLMMVVYGCRWKSTYSEILEVGLSMELTRGIPGWPFLCILGGSLSVGVLAFLAFNPSATFYGIFCCALNKSIVSLTVLVSFEVGFKDSLL